MVLIVIAKARQMKSPMQETASPQLFFAASVSCVYSHYTCAKSTMFSFCENGYTLAKEEKGN